MRLLPKLVLLMTVVAAVPLGLAGLNSIRISQNITRQQVRESHLRLSESLASSVQAPFFEAVQGLATAGRTFTFEELTPDERLSALKVLFFQRPEVDALVLLEPDGTDTVGAVAVTPDETPPDVLRTRARRDEAALARFRANVPLEAARKGGGAASPLYDVGGVRGPHVAVAVDVGDGRVLAAELSMETLRTRLDAFRIGTRGEAFLVDGKGVIAVHRDPKRTGQDLSAQPFIAERIASRTSASKAGEFEDAAGEKWIAAWAPVDPRMDWGIVVAQPERDAFVLSRELRGQTLIWILTALGFAVVLAVFYAREVGGPIEVAAEGARRLAAGELSHRIPGGTRDEVGEMVAAFNDMAGKLEASMAEISAWNATLQERVDERTRELREAQAELLQTKKLAAMGELGAGVAHELNNPLAGIKGFAQLLMMSRKPEDKEYKHLQTIEAQAKRCSDIVTRLLRFSQEGAAGQKLRVDANEVVGDALGMVEARLKEVPIEVKLALDPALPAVFGAPGELREVFWHILSNARNAMPRGGTLTVRTLVQGDKVAIVFADTGKGIDPAVIDRIFEPFFTTKDEWRGTGLGLAVVHRIVTEHRGKVTVESTPGVGSTFTVTVPIAAEGQLPVTSTRPDVATPRPKTQLV